MKKDKYRSRFEKDFAEAIHNKIKMEFEPEEFPYVMSKMYLPDFVYKEKIYIECKGFFREGDVKKYKAIRDMFIEKRKEFIFLATNRWIEALKRPKWRCLKKQSLEIQNHHTSLYRLT